MKNLAVGYTGIGKVWGELGFLRYCCTPMVILWKICSMGSLRRLARGGGCERVQGLKLVSMV